MSFLEHLEELRIRIFRALAAITAGFVAGWFLVERFHLVALLKAPIAPYVPGGRLTVLGPTEPLMIELKLAFIVGCILASPAVLWQVWAFLSPALYDRERKVVVPALSVGALLFLAGAALAFIFVVPQALKVLFSFQSDALAPMITYDAYFSFITQLMLAMGLSFELPLVIVILASFGLVTPAGLSRFRRFAIVLALVAGALLSPGTDVFSMLMLSVPMILLYEVGYAGSVMVWRRRLRHTTGAVLLLAALGLGARPAEAQQRPPALPAARPAPLAGRLLSDTLDTLRRAGPGKALDSASARRLGLPSAPSRQFPAGDSVLDALLARPGYEATRFMADSATLFVPERRIDLVGAAMTERNGSVLEAARIGYAESECVLEARGDPRVFDQGTVLVGEGLRYDTCRKRAVVSEALTNFQENGVQWFMRGDIAQDSTARRIYAAGSELTSCDLPVPHYHFQARQTKWISRTVMVARPAVLFVRDVPVLWLPFVFQDGRPGRRSGILVPQFGVNDVVRPNQGYSRQVTNIGYYWAPNDYLDATARFDWYAGRYYQWGVGLQYRWLDRATTGAVGVNRQARYDGNSSLQVRWNHQQNFSLTSQLALSLDFVSNTTVRNATAIDPLLNTQQIRSDAKYTKRFAWGQLSLGGSRRQSLTDGSVSQTFPAVTFSPNPIDLTPNVTWSPGLTFTQDRQLHQPGAVVVVTRPDGGLDTLGRQVNSRTTSFSLDTPLRLGGFTWRNAIAVSDLYTDQRKVETFTAPDPARPGDSVSVSRIVEGDFSTGIDWNTGINLPVVLRGSWKIIPGLGIANAVNGRPFLLRNRATGGQFLAQTKRAQFTLSSNPTFFAFLPGFGPISRIRHSVLPTLNWSYAPETSIPEDFARAIALPGQAPVLTAPASQTASLGLTQTFEAKGRPAPGDTSATPNVRKYRLLSIATSAVSYDFERAKRPGLTGWVTQTVSNSFQSDLLPGFNVALTHDLWRGTAGTDSARFRPYLTDVSASFAVSSATFRGLGRLVGLGGAREGEGAREGAEAAPPSYVAQALSKPRPGTFGSTDQVQRGGRGGFQSSFNLSVSRERPEVSTAPSRASLGFTTSFSPTAFWNLTWSSQYNITEGRFESQIVRLERDLHEWRASFNFLRNPNGNFALYFNIALMDLPDIKFDYNQTTLQR
ncbi:MAG TPA: twin-arginine translocase subunit TatC [Gemmatimonadales bacterium]|nr:twin-arginine translocase subunit TatC [Gemmatimonadales bacterium]